MNWLNLKQCECPKCNKKLRHGMLDDFYYCDTPGCEFSVSDERFKEIVSDMLKPKKKDRPRDNFYDLNKMGHGKMSRDFSDRL